MSEEIEIAEGTGSVFEDLGFADADLMELKASLAAELLRIMRERKISVRAVGKLAGVHFSDIEKIRKCKLDSFSFDRLYRIVRTLDKRVNVKITLGDESAAA